jgi:hypothetical protein
MSHPDDAGRVTLPILDACNEAWDDMSGDGHVRHCASCRKDVHDLSALSEEEAGAFLREHEAAIPCLRVAHDRSGKPLFRDDLARLAKQAAAFGAAAALAACGTSGVSGNSVAPANTTAPSLDASTGVVRTTGEPTTFDARPDASIDPGLGPPTHTTGAPMPAPAPEAVFALGNFAPSPTATATPAPSASSCDVPDHDHPAPDGGAPVHHKMGKPTLPMK